MKKIITASSIGLDSPYDGEDKNIDLALVDVTEKGERYGKAMVFSSAEFNEGFSNADKEIEKLFDFDLQGEEIEINPSTSQQVITPSAGKNGITKATVNAVTASIDSNISPENIVDGVQILGVTGTAPATPIVLYTEETLDMLNLQTILLGMNPYYIGGLANTLFDMYGVDAPELEGFLYNPNATGDVRTIPFIVTSLGNGSSGGIGNSYIIVRFSNMAEFSVTVKEESGGHFAIEVLPVNG